MQSVIARVLAIIVLMIGAGTAAAGWVQDVTPTPTMTVGSLCEAQVNYSWNVSSISNATGVVWELKRDSDFTNPNGQEPDRAAVGTGPVQGSVPIDLRSYGPVLNGTKYYFRVVAKQGNQDIALRSASVKFDRSYIPSGAMTLTAQSQGQVKLSWSLLPQQIASCSDRILYEIKKDSNFQNPNGPEPNRLEAGVLSGTIGEKTFTLQQYGPGDYYFRIVGKYGENAVDVGRRSLGARIALDAGLNPIRYALRVKVKDVEGTRCNTRQVIEGATVRVIGTGQGVDEPRTTNGQGVAEFQLPPGTYSILTSAGGCAADTRQFNLQAEVPASAPLEVALGGCRAANSDLEVSIESTGEPRPGQPYEVKVAVKNLSPGAPSAPASVALERSEVVITAPRVGLGTDLQSIDTGKLAETRGGGVPIRRWDIPGLCQNDRQPFSFVDTGLQIGKRYTYTARLTSPTDTQTANNTATTAVTVGELQAAPTGLVQPSIAITGFAIDGGAASTISSAVTLQFNSTGDARQYRVSGRPDYSDTVWMPFPLGAVTYNLDLVQAAGGGGYGRKTLYLQLKGSDGMMSLSASDSIIHTKTKRYTLSSSDLKAVLEYAKQQGFTFRNSLASSNLSSPKCFPTPFQDGFGLDYEGIDFKIPGMKILSAVANPGEVRAIDGTFFAGRRLNRFWKIVSDDLRVERGDGWDSPEAEPSQSSFSISRAPSNIDPSFTVRFKFTAKTNPIACERYIVLIPIAPVPLIVEGTCACVGAEIRLANLTLEGPEDDNWVDANNKWKNAFVRSN